MTNIGHAMLSLSVRIRNWLQKRTLNENLMFKKGTAPSGQSGTDVNPEIGKPSGREKKGRRQSDLIGMRQHRQL